MTEKRFIVKDDVGMLDVACGNIFDNGEFIGTVPLFDAEKFVDLLNELNDENKQLKQEKQEIFNYINKQSRINYDELKLWKKSNNKARKEKQVLIREANIMCLYNLLRDLTERVE